MKSIHVCEDDISLRTINHSDIFLIQTWKNENRDRFFFNGIISPEDQEKWYLGYLRREHDFMFIVEFQNAIIGCMGFRLLDDRIDIYNVIRGVPGLGRGCMGKGLKLMIETAKKMYPGHPVMASVLKSNPALDWYKKCGFRVVIDRDTYFEMCLIGSGESFQAW